MSETSLVKYLILPYIPEKCYGIDVGFGNDKIREDFIGADKERPYSGGTGYKVDLVCDVSQGIPSLDDTFDVVYSSHLIEDFVDTGKILREFIRIGKNGGMMILVFPDQQKYEQSCLIKNEIPNRAHKIKEMGMEYMLNQMKLIGGLPILTSFEVPQYNCVIIAEILKQRENNALLS